MMVRRREREAPVRKARLLSRPLLPLAALCLLGFPGPAAAAEPVPVPSACHRFIDDNLQLWRDYTPVTDEQKATRQQMLATFAGKAFRYVRADQLDDNVQGMEKRVAAVEQKLQSDIAGNQRLHDQYEKCIADPACTPDHDDFNQKFVWNDAAITFDEVTLQQSRTLLKLARCTREHLTGRR